MLAVMKGESIVFISDGLVSVVG